MKKLSRREAQLVAHARRDAVKRYKDQTLTGILLGKHQVVTLTLHELEWLNYCLFGQRDLTHRFSEWSIISTPRGDQQ